MNRHIVNVVNLVSVFGWNREQAEAFTPRYPKDESRERREE